ESLSRLFMRNAIAVGLPALVCRDAHAAFTQGDEIQVHPGEGRIINVSSRMGSTSHIGGGYPGYRISKATLNALTLILADELQGTKILVNAIHPGWVKTDMGGRSAPRSVEEGADTAVWLATLPDGGPSGGFFHGRELTPW
ncbi:MAG: SDR family NAD(P)-dependent oxidoreductase, partial [Nitrospinota bacterium]|nr:SDR family NAD(P)-dependent oxidoreductase [Nitrospinota bacterium]